jgi:hypothetical protein
MATNPDPAAASADLLQNLFSVYCLYAAMATEMDPESGLGGKLLYAGQLDRARSPLVLASNIAGAASLSASADAHALRQAMRNGVIDFLVTSLDEALRILKNQIRKRQPVAVGVSVAPETIVQEMLDRGVLPDLLPPQLPSTPYESEQETEYAAFIAQGAHRIQSFNMPSACKFLIWQIPAAYAQRPAEFEALLLEHLPPNDHAAHLWLRLSPRYLGPNARRLRSLACDEETASKLIDVFGPPLQP